MVYFESVSATEQGHYGDEFDRVMRFEEAATMRAIHLAAKAHIRYSESVGNVASGFFRGVLSLDPNTAGLMMNPSYIFDYSNMLLNYAEFGYLYADNGEELDVDHCRDRAQLLSDEIVQKAFSFETELTNEEKSI